ncbi:hypothetical protein K435DRAFT_247672 [Dendrothele bispora CBS 962.96]|uniref:Zn(2)-C6 fungal-type domain-containing protein n=1 Tax=Dendrothele bispora (strain CBS 962.96) TaxID=1314807 RepID=A0A4S8MLL5_DENBC|nr:hypothetical protein K435DRAFT_247672 [Dendrothele bispora CBS 962.96]
MSEEEGPAKSTSNKKRRLQGACDECRKRKVKCDSANMPGNQCSNCNVSHIECTHVLASVTKKRGPPKGKPRGSKTIRTIVSSILSTTKPFILPDSKEAILQLLVDLATQIRSMEEEMDQLQQKLYQATSTRSTANDTTDNQDSDFPQPQEILPAFQEMAAPILKESILEPDSSSLEGLSDKLKRLVIDQSLQRHFGTSSSLSLVRTAMDTNNPEMAPGIGCVSGPSSRVLHCRRAEFWAVYPWQIPPSEDLKPLVFPDRDLIPELVDLYFIHCNQFLPVLHRPTFERSVAEGLHYRNRQFGYTLLAVCAVGSRYSKDSRIFSDESSPEFSAGWKYFRQIKLFPQNFMTVPSLYDLQLICIAVFFLQATSTPEACWTLVGCGIRLAQEVGANQRRSGDTRPTVEGELWKRVFWMLYVIDVYVSDILGRPMATSVDDFDLDLPIECDDEYWETPDPNLAFKQPPGRPSNMIYWTNFLKLIEISSLVQRKVYRTRKSEMDPEWAQRTVSELDSMLNIWIDTVPDHLKWDPNREDIDFFHQSVSLYALYYGIQILVHKPFIPRPGASSEDTFPSMTICANAARSACHVMEVQQRRGFLPLPNVIVTLYNSALILTLNVWRGRQLKATSGTNKELVDVYKCIGMIRSYETRWQSAGTYCDIIREIILLTNLHKPLNDENRASLKRPRDSDREHTADPNASPDSTSSILSSTQSNTIGTRKIAGVNRVAAASRSSPGSSSPTSLPYPFNTDVQPNVNLNIDPIFSLPLRSDELGSLPLHESFDPFGDVHSFVHHTDMWMNEFNPQQELQQQQTFTTRLSQLQKSQGPQGGALDTTNDLDSRYSQQVMESLFFAMGPSVPDAASGEQTVQNMNQQSMQQDNFPVSMTSGDWNIYDPNLDDLLRIFMPS